MIKSMTGYGRAQEIVDGREITVEIRAVNHRFFEFSSRVPRAYAYLEEKLKSLLQGAIARGKVEAAVTVVTLEGESSDVQINHALAAQYLAALRGMGQDLGIQDDVTVSTIARFGDIFVVRRGQEDMDQVWEGARQVAEKALEGFLSMREVEGRRLREDLENRLAAMEELVSRVEEQSPRTVEAYRARLTQKMEEVLGQAGIDEQRILAEAAIFADHIAVDEETVRLRSHIQGFREIMDAGQAMGRKLDFLVQEMNREANTIGSKGQDVEVARIVVELKSQIEKIREQIQNIE